MEQDFIFIYDQAENVGFFKKQISFSLPSACCLPINPFYWLCSTAVFPVVNQIHIFLK